MTGEKGNFNEWGSPSVATIQEELASVVKRLRATLIGDVKHTGSITVHKAVIMPLLDELDKIATACPDVPYTCSQCPLNRHNQDLYVANKTVERLYALALSGKECPVTVDEAENLVKLIPDYM